MVHDDKVLYVIRGSRDTLDPTYACASHNNAPGKYALLEVDTVKGAVTKRQLTSSAAAVEQEAAKYRGIFMDTRDDTKLLRQPAVSHSQPANLDLIRRAKSDEELRDLDVLSRKTRELLENKVDENTFRGTANKMGNRSYFRAHHGKGFTEYRGGMKDAKGRCSDLTHVVPHNAAWEERLARVNRGLDRVTQAATAGVAVEDLDQIFRGCIDTHKDGVASSCVHSTGYESRENLRDFSRLAPYDFITIGVAVSDGVDTALVYRGTKQVMPETTMPPPPTARSPPTPPSPPPKTDPPPIPSRSLFRGSVPVQSSGSKDGMAGFERAFM